MGAPALPFPERSVVAVAICESAGRAQLARLSLGGIRSLSLIHCLGDDVGNLHPDVFQRVGINVDLFNFRGGLG